MRTFHLKGVEKGEGQWEITWGSEDGLISPADMHWILVVAGQALIDKSKGPPGGGIPGNLLIPSPN